VGDWRCVSLGMDWMGWRRKGVERGEVRGPLS
jgi:hypothetical protein